jgi:hypothetical protein
VKKYESTLKSSLIAVPMLRKLWLKWVATRS